MAAVYKKFATQADPKVLDAVRAIAASEGKKLQNDQAVGMGSNGRAAVSAGVAVSDD